MARLLVLFACLCFGLGSLHADDKLVRSFRKGNTTAVNRRARQLGSIGLARALASSDRGVKLAALYAANDAKDRWALLGALAALAAVPDRSIAAPAAQVGAEIAHDMTALIIETEEVPTSFVERWRDEWLAIARDQRRWMDIRIYALEAASQLAELVPGELAWAELFSDSDPQMRAAALLFVPRRLELAQKSRALLADDSNAVKVAAAQRLCTQDTLPALSPAEWESLRAIAGLEDEPVGGRLELLYCLGRDDDERSKKAFRALLQEAPREQRAAFEAQATSAPRAGQP